MDLQAPQDKFFVAAQEYASLLEKGADPPQSDARTNSSGEPFVEEKPSLLNVLKIISEGLQKDVDESISEEKLQLAQTKMIDAMKCYEESLEQVRRGTTLPVNATGGQRQQSSMLQTLPLETVQRIIAIAYEEEEEEYVSEHKGEPVDYRDNTARRGAMGLATHNTSATNGLFSLTRLTVMADLPSCFSVKYDDAPRARYRVVFSGDPYVSRDRESTITFMQKRAGEVKTLRVCKPGDLEDCREVLFSLNRLEYSYSRAGEREPDGASLRRESETWEEKQIQNKIRSATIASPFLKTFVSSGILRNITDLAIPFGLDLHTDLTWPTLDEILRLLPDFPKLVSIELIHGYSYTEGRSSSVFTAAADAEEIRDYYTSPIEACPELPSLRRLKTRSLMGVIAERVVFAFSRCVELREVLFLRDIFRRDAYHAWRGDRFRAFCCRLSDTFPRLESLAFATLDVRTILDRRLGSGDGPASGNKNENGIENGNGNNVWNFPNLHTLDIRGAAPPSSVEEMTGIPGVLYERARAAARTVPVGVDTDTVEEQSKDKEKSKSKTTSTIDVVGPARINRFCMDTPQVQNIYIPRRRRVGFPHSVGGGIGDGGGVGGGGEETRMLLRCLRLLVYFALEGIVPNFVWDRSEGD